MVFMNCKPSFLKEMTCFLNHLFLQDSLLWKEMVESKVLCSAAISACESGSQWQVAFEIFRQQEELGLGKSKTHSAVFCWTGLFKLE